jgi:NAD(P)-dependent dehydrogenase (short-subunit alcohol dehydrogenase family)
MNETLRGSLAGKAAIVTGASQEIGAAMAETLAARGVAVVVGHYQEPALAEATVSRIRAAGGAAVAHDADCSNVGEAQAMISRAVAEFGRLDIFVGNAGLTMWAPFLEYTEMAWDTVMDLNLKGSFFGAQAAARQMIRQGTPGSIVFSSSGAGVRAVSHLSAYGISKAGLCHMARCLALELGPHHITVNALGIGPIVNARNLKDDPDYNEHWAEYLPAGRAGRPDDVARALLFLVENDFVTGATMMLDGGQTITTPIPRLDFLDRQPDGRHT